MLARPGSAEDALWAALDRARLGDWLRTQPLGLDTPVGPAGSALSGGQARRLLLARALLSDAEIILLDEPTEHLDRLDDVDEIVELAHGRVVRLSHSWAESGRQRSDATTSGSRASAHPAPRAHAARAG